MRLSWHIVSSQGSREEYRERPHQIRYRLGKKEEKRRKEEKKRNVRIKYDYKCKKNRKEERRHKNQRRKERYRNLKALNYTNFMKLLNNFIIKCNLK